MYGEVLPYFAKAEDVIMVIMNDIVISYVNYGDCE